MALCSSWGVGARRGGLPRRRAAERSERHEFCSMQNIPCSAPSTVVTQARHGGRKGRLTAVTHVFYNTCVMVQKEGEWRSSRSASGAPGVASARR